MNEALKIIIRKNDRAGVNLHYNIILLLTVLCVASYVRLHSAPADFGGFIAWVVLFQFFCF